MSSAVPKPGESLADLFPKIAAQWDEKRNGDASPFDVKPQSNRKFFWICPDAADHRWDAAPMNRVRSPGCPFCRGRRVTVSNSFLTGFPDLAKEWHPTKNGDLTPVDVYRNSTKKYWWQCSVDLTHEWQATPRNRGLKGTGCRFCAGKSWAKSRRTPRPGHSLAEAAPLVAESWDYERNGEVTPHQVNAYTHDKFDWICPVAEDHRWSASVAHRHKTGCPYCAGKKASSTNNLRDHGPPAAVSQWDYERNSPIRPEDVLPRSGKTYWWRCDVAEDHRWKALVGNRTTLETACPYCWGRKASSTNNFRDHGPSDAVTQWDYERNGSLRPEDFSKGSGKVVWWKCEVAEDHRWKTSIAHRSSGQDCKYCQHGSSEPSSTNNLRDHGPPNVVAEWDYERNGDLRPEDVRVSAKKVVHWKCPVANDHRWRTQVHARTGMNKRNCPYCRGYFPSSTNNLRDHGRPYVVAEWDYEANDPLRPEDVTISAGKKVHWRCSVEPTHRWSAVVDQRNMRGNGCSECTLVPRSAQEMRLAHELSALIDFDLDAHKVRFAGRLRDVDIVLDDLKVVVEFDGAYWHRNKVDKDREKTVLMEEAGWQVIRVRERPLDPIHVNDVMVDTMAPAKTVADLVLNKIVEVTGTDVPQLDEYLASEGPWRDAEALKAIRAYQAERASKKAAKRK